MSTRWWKAHGRAFVLATLATAIGVCVVGWLTAAREVMYAALLACLVTAALPFVIAAAGVALIGLMLLLATAIGLGGGDPGAMEGIEGIEGGARMVEGGVRLAPRYYAFLARRRHPAFWGCGLGVLLGGLVLWAALALFVIPGETRTTDALERAGARIDLYYAEHGALPRPDDEHHLVLDGVVVEDGFGRPLDYRVRGISRLATWQLRSHGHDGEPGGDDLCLDGGTPAVRRLEAAAQLLQQLDQRSASLGERLARLNTLRCER